MPDQRPDAMDDDLEQGRTPENCGAIATLVLAAGSSTRMGNNKMLLRLEGDTVVRRAVSAALDAELGPVIVVTGHQRDEIEAELQELRGAHPACVLVHNDDHEDGIHTSVRAGLAGLAEIAGLADAVIIMLADMPYVTTAMLVALAARYRQSDPPLVLSRYGGEVNAPPMLYDRSLFGELSAMRRRCGREVIKRHRDQALELDWPRTALADIDTPDDFARVHADLSTHEKSR